MALTLTSSCYISMCLNWLTIAPTLPSVSFIKYVYLLSENGCHGVDAREAALHEHLLELSKN